MKLPLSEFSQMRNIEAKTLVKYAYSTLRGRWLALSWKGNYPLDLPTRNVGERGKVILTPSQLVYQPYSRENIGAADIYEMSSLARKYGNVSVSQFVEGDYRVAPRPLTCRQLF
ncbi:MAG: hypothetical protein R2827_14595 [Bdellovibrionales bacterium]